jgi:hypothetical protein
LSTFDYGYKRWLRQTKSCFKILSQKFDFNVKILSNHLDLGLLINFFGNFLPKLNNIEIYLERDNEIEDQNP